MSLLGLRLDKDFFTGLNFLFSIFFFLFAFLSIVCTLGVAPSSIPL